MPSAKSHAPKDYDLTSFERFKYKPRFKSLNRKSMLQFLRLVLKLIFIVLAILAISTFI